MIELVNTVKEPKTTKKEYFAQIIELCENANRIDLADVMRHEIELIENKAAKSKTTKSAKSAEPDELMNAIVRYLNGMGEEWSSIEDILGNVDESLEATKNKIIARMTKLVANGIAERAKAQGEDKKTFTVYREGAGAKVDAE